MFIAQIVQLMIIFFAKPSNVRKGSITSVHNWEKKNNIRLACHINSRHFVASALVSTKYYQQTKRRFSIFVQFECLS